MVREKVVAIRRKWELGKMSKGDPFYSDGWKLDFLW